MWYFGKLLEINAIGKQQYLQEISSLDPNYGALKNKMRNVVGIKYQ